MMNKIKICRFCGSELSPKKYANGAVEDYKQFLRRQFCNCDCSRAYHLQAANNYWFSEDGLVGYGTVSTGEIFIFDSEDYKKIKNIAWYRCNKGIRVTENYIGDNKGVCIHRYILQAPTGMEIDHINLNPLDNRKSNLRICTHRENQCNQPLQSNNTSGVSGVKWQKNRKTWNAEIKYYGHHIHLGAYHSFLEAVQARNEGMRWLFGEYGRYNDVPGAPHHIKEYVKNKCSRFIDESTVYFCPEVVSNG